jgi:hypothetical protein|tara:strand:- start:1918 stop:2481 length:564 start_codon:yes stop_codon:yes gene_type:complete
MSAQEYRDATEPTVEQTAKALRGRSAAKRDEATEQVKAVLVRANELGISHPSAKAIAVALVVGDAKQLAATITEPRSAGFGNGPKSTSSHMAWLLHAIHKAENPWTPGGKGRLLSKDEFRAMKVRNGGHIPDGMSIKEAVAAGFLTADGKPVVHDTAALPDDIRKKVDDLVALGYTEEAALRFVRTQ